MQKDTHLCYSENCVFENTTSKPINTKAALTRYLWTIRETKAKTVKNTFRWKTVFQVYTSNPNKDPSH